MLNFESNSAASASSSLRPVGRLRCKSVIQVEVD